MLLSQPHEIKKTSREVVITPRSSKTQHLSWLLNHPQRKILHCDVIVLNAKDIVISMELRIVWYDV